MARRDIKTLRVSEIPPSVTAAYALRNEYKTIPREVAEILHTVKSKSTSSGFRDFSSLKGGARSSASDAEGFQEVRRWGKPHSERTTFFPKAPVSSPSLARTYTEPLSTVLRIEESFPPITPVATAAVAASVSAPVNAPVSATVSAPVNATVSTSVSVTVNAAVSAPTESPIASTEGGSISTFSGIRFGAYGRPGRREKTFEESEKSKIQSKLNKITDSNYERTKEFLKQFLDPRDTSVLTDFVNAVFDTAAMTAVLCKICTRLLHELADEYPHVRVEMLRLFQNFLFIFDETIGTPEVSSENYNLFLEAQKRKRARRGYSRFIAELVILKELSVESYVELLKALTRSLQKASVSEENEHECTEYADCLKLLFQTRVRPSGEWLAVLVEFATLPVSELPPGIKPQAKFALLDIVEALHLK
jgi:hypothetical protein